MPKTVITSPKVISPRRPFSQAVRSGGTIYVAGQLPVDADGNTVGPGDIRQQTRQALENIKAILQAAGAGLDDVVKTTMYLTDIAYHDAVNDVYVEYFPANYPARTTIQVAALAPAMRGEGHPFLIEIDAVAVVDQSALAPEGS